MTDFLTFKDGKITQGVNISDGLTLLGSLGWNFTPPGGTGGMMTPPATPAQ